MKLLEYYTLCRVDIVFAQCDRYSTISSSSLCVGIRTVTALRRTGAGGHPPSPTPLYIAPDKIFVGRWCWKFDTPRGGLTKRPLIITVRDKREGCWVRRRSNNGFRESRHSWSTTFPVPLCLLYIYILI